MPSMAASMAALPSLRHANYQLFFYFAKEVAWRSTMLKGPRENPERVFASFAAYHPLKPLITFVWVYIIGLSNHTHYYTAAWGVRF